MHIIYDVFEDWVMNHLPGDIWDDSDFKLPTPVVCIWWYGWFKTSDKWCSTIVNGESRVLWIYPLIWGDVIFIWASKQWTTWFNAFFGASGWCWHLQNTIEPSRCRPCVFTLFPLVISSTYLCRHFNGEHDDHPLHLWVDKRS